MHVWSGLALLRVATGGFNPRSVCCSSSVSIGKGGAAFMYGRLVWVGALEVRDRRLLTRARFVGSSVSIGKGGIGCKIVFWPQFHSWCSDDSSGLWHIARIQ